MGSCPSRLSAEEERILNQQKAHTRVLDRQLKERHQNDQKVIKVLLLGAGESGKSTVFKQMVLIHGKGFSDEEREQYRSIVASNVLTSIQELCRMSTILQQHGVDTAVSPSLERSFRTVSDCKLHGVDTITPQMAAHIKALWGDPGIKRAYGQRHRFYLIDSAEYFLDSIDHIAVPSYIPSIDDVLRARMRTTAIIEQDFEVKGNLMRFVDVGGQRNERRKWIHCFAGVTSVLFVASLAEYDQVLYEDDTTNRMDESLALFEEVCQLEYFARTSIILFLNKSDLFRQKVTTSKIEATYPEYGAYLQATGEENSFESGVNFIQQMFIHLNKTKRQIFPHTTCATDRAMMQHVFTSVQRIIIRRNLQAGGLLTDEDTI